MLNNKTWNVDLIGTLADKDYVLDSIDKQAEYINSQNVIQFFVKIISQTPDSFPNIKLVTCYGTDLEKWGFEDNYNAHQFDRLKALEDFLKDSLIIFKPERKILYDHSEVIIGRQLRLIAKSESFDDRVKLIPIPIFSTKEHNLSYSEFFDKLTSRKYVGRIDDISSETEDTPEYILWKSEEDEFTVIGEFEKHHYAHGGFSFLIKNGLKTAPFEDEWLDECYEENNILYVTYEVYTYLSGLISAQDPLMNLGRENSEGEKAVREIAASFEEFTSSTEERGKPIAFQKEMGMTEKMLMKHFIQYTRDQGLLYDYKDLYNFHTAMKSSNLVILAGMSGTGKSKLVQAYGKALGLYDQLTFIPVRPSWTDDADLIGYADTLHMVYRPGDSGLINTLLNAKENKGKLYVICFDEMNLARVEHYFSQFLSVLEMESGPRKVLRLYNDDLESRLYNSAQYPPIIPIGDNVIFVGTVNLDESTYHFSDKVLDRSNVISLNVLPFSDLSLLMEENNNLSEERKNQFKNETEISFGSYESFKNTKREFELAQAELELLWDIHLELQKVNKNLGAGPRIVRQIDYYIKNLPENEYLSRKQALDLQIVQRIFTKVRGPEEQFKKLIGCYDSQNNRVTGSSLLRILEKYEDVSDFEETRKVLIHKARELKTNGYCI